MTEEEKAAAAKVREGIKVKNVSELTAEEIEAAKVAAEAADKEAADAEATEVAAKAEADKAAAEAAAEGHTQTEEELEAEKLEAKTAAEKAKIQKRIDREVAKRKVLEDKVKELEAKLAADPDKTNALTEEEVEKRALTKAQQIALQKEFDDKSNKLFDGAVKADKEFKKKVDAMAEDLGPIPGAWVGILDDLDNGSDVLVYLVDHTDEAEDIYKYGPVKAGVALSKLSVKVAEAKKPKAKEISKVPDPASLNGGGQQKTTTPVLTGKESMEDFVRIRQKQVEERRKLKMGVH